MSGPVFAESVKTRGTEIDETFISYQLLGYKVSLLMTEVITQRLELFYQTSQYRPASPASFERLNIDFVNDSSNIP